MSKEKAGADRRAPAGGGRSPLPLRHNGAPRPRRRGGRPAGLLPLELLGVLGVQLRLPPVQLLQLLQPHGLFLIPLGLAHRLVLLPLGLARRLLGHPRLAPLLLLAAGVLGRYQPLFPNPDGPQKNSLASRSLASPDGRGCAFYGPFTGTESLKIAVSILQQLLQFRTCTLDLKSSEEKWKWFRPCLLHSIRRCTAPCNLRVSREDYRRQIKKLIFVLEGKKDKLLLRMEREMLAASEALNFEKARRIRDEITALKNLDLRGDVDRDCATRGLPD